MKKLFNFLFSIFFAGVILISSVIAVYANIPSPSSVFYVLDEADVLSDATERRIVAENTALYEKCGAQIVVVCVKTTGNKDIADYALELFNEWGIGSKEKNNGLLILLSVNEDDYYVLQGRGLEDLLSSGTIKVMLDEYLEPYFAEMDYDSGVNAVFTAFVKFVGEIYSADISISETFYGETELTDASVGKYTSSWLSPIRLIRAVKSAIKFVFKFVFKRVFFTAAIIIIVISLIKRNRRGGGGKKHRPTNSQTFHHNPGVFSGGAFNNHGGPPHRRPGGSSGFGTGSSGGGFSHGGSSGGGFSHGGSASGGSNGGGGFSRGGGAGRR